MPARPQLSLFLITGVLGGFTTMSSFGTETVSLWEGGQHALAAGYAIGTLVLCLVAVLLGRMVGQMVARG